MRQACRNRRLQTRCGSDSAHKASARLQGIVEKIVKSAFANAPDKAQIKVAGADHLDRKIRVDNTLIIKAGKEVSLKLGAQVEVTVETEAWSTILDS
jgi:hypothetical protein